LAAVALVVASGLGLAACGGGSPAAVKKHVASTTAPTTPGAPTTQPLGPDVVTQLNGQLSQLDTMLNQATTDLSQAPSDS
jgi:hypothetical protein